MAKIDHAVPKPNHRILELAWRDVELLAGVAKRAADEEKRFYGFENDKSKALRRLSNRLFESL